MKIWTGSIILRFHIGCIKRSDVTYAQSRNNNFLKKLNDPDVIKYISITNPDKSGMDNLLYASKRYQPEE
jgi:hypothetical protein